MAKVLQMDECMSIERLFINMSRTQNELNKNTKICLIQLNRKCEILQAFIIAISLIVMAMSIGFGMAIKKLQTMPVTVYQTGSQQTVDITKLPLPPLEEIEVK